MPCRRGLRALGAPEHVLAVPTLSPARARVVHVFQGVGGGERRPAGSQGPRSHL